MSESALEEALEERSSLKASIAAGLAELSSAEIAPLEVDSTSPFEPEDVQFEGTVWIDYLIRVQDWLRLSNPILPGDDSEVAATKLMESLSGNDSSATLVSDDDSTLLTDSGLEILRDRVDRALNLKDRFIELAEGGSVEDATALWIEEWDSTVEETISGPILAKAGIWPITDFASRAKTGRLELFGQQKMPNCSLSRYFAESPFLR